MNVMHWRGKRAGARPAERGRSVRPGFVAALRLILLACLISEAAAAEPKDNGGTSTKSAAPAGQGEAAGKAVKEGIKGSPSSPKIPDQFKLSMMIRSMIIAVNHANKTGNYTVLRDLGSPRFRKANGAKELALIFKDLRESKFDLSPIFFFTPKLTRLPDFQDGMLRLTGFFETRPQLVTFDFLFENIEGEWMLFGIDLGTQPAPQGESKADGGNAPSAK
jgi:hypothetical protein